MLPEQLRVLMSAYMSGDLPPRQRAAARRLLRHSRDARRLLRDLKRDRRRLRSLPSPLLPAGFADQVVRSLPKRSRIIRHSPMSISGRSSLSPVARWSAAAVVLIAVGLGASLLTGLAPPRADLSFSAPKSRRVTDAARAVRADRITNEVDPRSSEVEPLESPRLVLASNSPAKATATSDPSVVEPLGSVSAPGVKLVTVAPPRLLTTGFAAFATSEGRQRFCEELTKGRPVSVDLFSRDPARGFERLQAALKQRGVRVIVDAVAHEAGKRKLRGHYLVYCEALTAAEWLQVLQSLAAADKRAGETPFDSAVVTPVDVGDQAELIAILGADPTRTEPRNGAGGLTRPSATKGQGKTAVAAIATPWRTPPGSKEVRQFFDTRPEQPENAVGVILVVRPPLS